jgi:hypothetical protein
MPGVAPLSDKAVANIFANYEIPDSTLVHQDVSVAALLYFNNNVYTKHVQLVDLTQDIALLPADDQLTPAQRATGYHLMTGSQVFPQVVGGVQAAAQITGDAPIPETTDQGCGAAWLWVKINNVVQDFEIDLICDASQTAKGNHTYAVP